MQEFSCVCVHDSGQLTAPSSRRILSNFQIWLTRSQWFPQEILWRSKGTSYCLPKARFSVNFFCVAHSWITRFLWPTFSLVKGTRWDKFNKILKNKLTKIAQISVKISSDVDFQDFIVFIGLACCFIFSREASRFLLNVDYQKRHFQDRIRLMYDAPYFLQNFLASEEFRVMS